jgi:hypothetical protein
MYELIDFNGFLNVQVAGFTALVAIFRFLTARRRAAVKIGQFDGGAASL